MKKALRKLLKLAFRGNYGRSRANARLHRTINERCEVAEALRANVRDGYLGVYWSGRTYCDSNGAFMEVEATRVKPAPTVWTYDEWLEETDPWIEGPCTFKLFPPSPKDIVRGY